jgi:hypothetical protein
MNLLAPESQSVSCPDVQFLVSYKDPALWSSLVIVYKSINGSYSLLQTVRKYGYMRIGMVGDKSLVFHISSMFILIILLSHEYYFVLYISDLSVLIFA